jgi:hypothetical protein
MFSSLVETIDKFCSNWEEDALIDWYFITSISFVTESYLVKCPNFFHLNQNHLFVHAIIDPKRRHSGQQLGRTIPYNIYDYH